MKHEIDINCDMGESYGQFKVGNDAQIFPYITSCNIACGFHGGDPFHIEQTVKQAIAHNVQIGAHPSYPDLLGFGRRAMKLPYDELKAIVKYQIAALKGLVESHGGTLTHVKPHGALYNVVADNQAEALAVIDAVLEIDETLTLMGLAGSPIEDLAKKKQLSFINEAFADRSYTKLGRLKSRGEEGALITDPEVAAQQMLSIVLQEKVSLEKSLDVAIKAQSICIHGDNPMAVNILKAIKRETKKHKIALKPFFK